MPKIFISHPIQIVGVWGKSTWFLYRTLRVKYPSPHGPYQRFQTDNPQAASIHKCLLFGLYTPAFKFVSCPLFFFFLFNGWESILKFWVFALLAKSEEINIMVKIRRLLRSSLLLPMSGYFPVSHSLYSSLLPVWPNIHLLCSSGSWKHFQGYLMQSPTQATPAPRYPKKTMFQPPLESLQWQWTHHQPYGLGSDGHGDEAALRGIKTWV